MFNDYSSNTLYSIANMPTVNKNFLLTIQYDHSDYKQIILDMDAKINSIIALHDCELNFCRFQVEICPTTRRYHIQMFLQFTQHTIYATIKELLGCNPHIEVARNVQKSLDYCGKEQTRVPNTIYYDYGVFRQCQQGKRTDLDQLRQSILEGKSDHDVIMEDSSNIRYISHIQRVRFAFQQEKWSKTVRNIEVIYIHGPTGVGKTHMVYEREGYQNVFRIPPPTQPTALLWFDGYNHENVLFLDEFTGWCSYRFLLQLLDKYPLRLPIKNSHVMAAFSKVYICSTRSLDQQYPKIGDKSELYRRVTETIELTESWQQREQKEEQKFNQSDFSPIFNQANQEYHLPLNLFEHLSPNHDMVEHAHVDDHDNPLRSDSVMSDSFMSTLQRANAYIPNHEMECIDLTNE